MNHDYANQVIDGVMLSDGGLRRPRRITHNSYFYLNQSFGEEHLDWILFAKEALVTLGFTFSNSTPYIESVPGINRKHRYCSLWSQYSVRATQEYHRWYLDGRKVVPEGLLLTPVSIANWFMGDATSAWATDNLVTVCFATHAFGTLDARKLAGLLVDQGIDAYQGWNKGCPVIHVTTIEGVTSLMEVVRPHILTSFDYKIKIPWRKHDYPRRTRRVG